MKKIFLVIFILFALGTVFGCNKTSDDNKYSQAESLVMFVENAVKEIETKGENTFSEFRKEGGKWFDNYRYIFVWGLDGERYVYPPNTSQEGINVKRLKDPDGKPIGELFIKAAKSEKGSGWVHYKWPKPDTLFPAWKSSYIKKAISPAGREYLVGSGIYISKADKIFIADMVDKAALKFEKEGTNAFNLFRNKSGEFVFADAYLFVYDGQGTCIFNQATPSIEGKNLFDYQDANGKYLIREFYEKTKRSDKAWVDFMWPKPGKSIQSRKSAYIRKVTRNNQLFIIGSGIYLD